MNINMSEIQFNKLIELCQNSKKELSGIMSTEVKNEEIFITDIKLDDKDVIKSSNSSQIIFDTKEYLTKIIYELAFTNSPVYISFHTHPGFAGAPYLSKADTDNLKYVQSLTKKVNKTNSSNSTTVIEGIITNSEIAFYTYDLDCEKIIRIRFLVDGVEKIPSIEKGQVKVFKESFLEGRRARK